MIILKGERGIEIKKRKAFQLKLKWLRKGMIVLKPLLWWTSNVMKNGSWTQVVPIISPLAKIGLLRIY